MADQHPQNCTCLDGQYCALEYDAAYEPDRGCTTCGFDFGSLGLDECTVCKAAKRLSGADRG